MPTRHSQWVVLSLCALFTACGSIQMTLTGPAQPAKRPGCEFQIYTMAPASPFVEIGAIDITIGVNGENRYPDIPALKEGIQPLVCQAGGDAAIAYANGFGVYMKATIVKLTGAAPGPSGSAKETAASDGCRYDTQCKGDRLCVDGRCVDPPK
jgi:hypothetical protein